ncbi:secreted RxLR effector protein 161-like [Pyrus communis]|uniref:secreted RxLR effector protein 161-like n=1 Tax=Pyrus communis TaxID=23211 RepID=UPI0035C11590
MPDIAYIVGILGRFQSNPREAHWNAAKKVLWYLQRTKSYMLVYGKDKGLEISGYTNSDLAEDLNERKSTGGYVFLLGGGAISWKSAKQTIIATLTIEAEFVAWLCSLLCKDNKRTSASRLMDVKFLKVKEKVEEGTIDVQHLNTSMMVADPFTKALLVGIFKLQVSRMGILENFDQWE